MAPMKGGGESSVTGSYVVPQDLIGKEEHHVCWNKALQDALSKTPDDWRGQTVSIQQSAYITPNPGSVGEYKILVKPGG